MEQKNDFLSLAKGRTTVYKYSTRPISEEDLYYILEAGRWAPSAGNSQPWHFVVIQDKPVIHRIIKDCPYDGKFHSDPPVLVAFVLCAKSWFGTGSRFIKKLGRVSYPEAYLSMGMPAMNMALAAQCLGIGSCMLTPNGPKAAKMLETAPDDQVVLFLGLGYETEGAFEKKSPRKELKEIVSFRSFTGPGE
ncbi:MAG: nitroreductase family protein [Candidatus Micrarchaeota archaeon]|nr:nitroreductase family protein [Candidatus Micrarchaeota archaeon]